MGATATSAGAFKIGGDLELTRLGYGAMRITGEGIWGPPKDHDDAIAVRSMMNVCMSLDHRVIDGAVASGFLSDLKKRLEAMGPSGSL